MTTFVTQVGVAAAAAAIAGTGPKININSFKVGPVIIPPVLNDPATDITDSVFTGTASLMQYAVVDANTVEYIITLDENTGNPPFSVGRIGLFTDNGSGVKTLFSITAIDAPSSDYKFSTHGNQVGNRLTYAIYLTITNFSKITAFTIPLLPIVSVPESQSEQGLPDPLHVAFNTSQVWRHSIPRVPVLAYRETGSQGRNPPAWLSTTERLLPGAGEGVIPVDPSAFDSAALVNNIVALDYANVRVIKGDPSINKAILGIRTGQEEITNYGMYVDPVNTYSPMQLIYAGTGSNAGNLTTVQNNWPVGFAIGPTTFQNYKGWLCWVDFTIGGGIGRTGPQGPAGPQGPKGPSGVTAGLLTPGCYLTYKAPNLALIPYNGNSIIINQTVQKIPYQGVSLAPTGVTPGTLQYIYAYMNGTTMMLEASTAMHVTSQIDGVEIKNQDQSRTLVGMAMPITGPSWTDVAPGVGNQGGTGAGGGLASGYTLGQLYVLSWFNPRPKDCTSYLTPSTPGIVYNPPGHEGINTSSTDWIELTASLRCQFLTWAGRETRFTAGASGRVVAPRGMATAVQFDSGGYEKYFTSSHDGAVSGAAQYQPTSVRGTKRGLAEGAHVSTLLGLVSLSTSQTSGGVATWQINMGINTNNYAGRIEGPTSLTITVDG